MAGWVMAVGCCGIDLDSLALISMACACMCVNATMNGSPERFVPKDYEPPMPTWKSKAGGVYIPIVRK